MSAVNTKVSYDELINLKDDSSVLIVDVREPEEIEKTGLIPGSVNIPLGKLKDVLIDSTEEDFKEVYGRTKPDNDSRIVFTCQSGRRATNAYEIASEIGYDNACYYEGGWLEWESKLQN